MREIFVWIVPLTAIAGVIDWLVIRDAMEHRRQHGHLHFPTGLTGLGVLMTGIAVSMIGFFVHARRPPKTKNRGKDRPPVD